MRSFSIILFFISFFLPAPHGPDGCDIEDRVCVSHLEQDVSDSNDLAVLKMVAVGGGIAYYFIDRRLDSVEKEEFAKRVDFLNGVPILDNKNFQIVLPVPSDFRRINPSNVENKITNFGNKFLNNELEIVQFRFSF